MDLLTNTIDKHAPQKTKIVSNRKKIPWFSGEVSNAIRSMRRADVQMASGLRTIQTIFLEFYRSRLFNHKHPESSRKELLLQTVSMTTALRPKRSLPYATIHLVGAKIFPYHLVSQTKRLPNASTISSFQKLPR